MTFATNTSRNVCVFWTKSTQYYVDTLGLREQAELHHKQGLTETVHALCAEGYDLILDDIEYLRSLGYLVHDCSREFAKLKAEFPVLAKAKSEFHYYNMLRWLLIGRMFPGEPVLCFDADLVLNVPASSIIDDNGGRTFMVGSTCFVHISDDTWFRGYEETLRRFENDIDAFWEEWQQKADHPFIKITTKDDIDEERFVRFCVEAGFVPNQWPGKDSQFLYVPFPTLLDGFTMPFRSEKWVWPISYTRVGACHHFNGEPLAFLHFQREFSYLLASWLIQRQVFGVERPSPSIPPHVRRFPIPDDHVRRYLRATTQLLDGIMGMSENNENVRRCSQRSYQVTHFSEVGFGEIFVDDNWYRTATFAPINNEAAPS
jgi:hypothetical protein